MYKYGWLVWPKIGQNWLKEFDITNSSTRYSGFFELCYNLNLQCQQASRKINEFCCSLSNRLLFVKPQSLTFKAVCICVFLAKEGELFLTLSVSELLKVIYLLVLVCIWQTEVKVVSWLFYLIVFHSFIDHTCTIRGLYRPSTLPIFYHFLSSSRGSSLSLPQCSIKKGSHGKQHAMCTSGAVTQIRQCSSFRHG